MIFVGQSLLNIELDTRIDLTGGSNAKVRYRKPSGVTGEWSASIVGNSIVYAVQDGDLNEAGTWRLQGEVTVGGRVGLSDPLNMKVDNLFA